MKPHRFLFLFLIGLLQSGWAADRPNLVIILTDDQGTLDAGCYGASDLHTPHMDSLAKTGIRFTQAYAHSVCCPTRAALMTGRYPQRSGVNSWTQREIDGPKGINMAAEEVTIAEILQQAGYRTGLFGKWHLGAHREHGPMKQGFDEFFGIREGFIDNYVHYHLHNHGFHDLFEGTKEIWARGKYFPQMQVDRALKFLEANKQRPFFLYLPFNIPHYPEQSLKQFSQRYKNLKEPRRTYAAAISTTDHFIGLVLEKLDSLGIRDNTIVLFMSDNGHSEEDYQIKRDDHPSGLPNGYNYGANGGGGYTGKWIGHKGTFLEGGIRVPAILNFPKKLPSGIARDQIVTAMDWLPTLVPMCGAEVPKTVKLDGHDIHNILRSSTADSPNTTLHFQWQSKWAVRAGEWKLINMPQSKNDNLTLHRLTDEKPEAKNYTSEKPDQVRRLVKLHNDWTKDIRESK